MRFIFATNNENKLREIRGILGEKYREFFFSMKDMDVHIEPEENGNDFIENADIKAKALYEELKKQNKIKKGDYIISDDTGLCIDYLKGAPGVMSARFMGENTAQVIKNKKIIELMKDVKGDKRKAYFITVLSVIEEGEKEILHFEGRIDGSIAESIEGISGFGYDPIFAVDGVTYSSLGEDGKNAISHRARAIKKFIEYLNGAGTNKLSC